MKRFFLALGLVALMVGFMPQQGCCQEVTWRYVKELIRHSFPDVPQISTDSLAQRLATPTTTPIVLLDVREAEEYAVSHLAGAMQVSPRATDFPMLAGLARDTPIVTYCSVGYRSSALAQRLQELGFTHVANLEGSLFQWANEGKPMVRNEQPVAEAHPFDAVWGVLLQAPFHAYQPAPKQ